MLNLKVGGNFEYAEGNRTAISPLCKLLQKGVRRLKYLDFSDNWNNETEFKKCLKAIRKGSLMQSLEELKLGGLGGSFLFSMKYFGMELAKIVEAAQALKRMIIMDSNIRVDCFPATISQGIVTEGIIRVNYISNYENYSTEIPTRRTTFPAFKTEY